MTGIKKENLPQQEPLILTLRLDKTSQDFFDAQRARYFPPERNFLKAHLTLFHQLPDEPTTTDFLSQLVQPGFEMTVSGILHLGAGVAYKVESPELLQLHRGLSGYFKDHLIPQDRQPYKPHITIQNKVSPERSRKLAAFLENTFYPFAVQATGLDLWRYLGGPWQHLHTYPFK